MAWDSTRPVPWRRLVREWAIYGGIMAVIFLLFFRERGVGGAMIGIALSLPLYLALGWVLAKLGYERTRLRRPTVDTSSTATTTATSTAPARARPAPTKRTGGGTDRPSAGRKRR